MAKSNFHYQKAAIIAALLSGKTLTTLDGVRDFGTVKLPTRIREYEKEFKFLCHREERKFTSRYGVKGCQCLEYTFFRSKYPDSATAMEKYVLENSGNNNTFIEPKKYIEQTLFEQK